MAATEMTNRPASPSGRLAGATSRPPVAAFFAVAVGSIAILTALCYQVFLFWDDFLFLGEARATELTWDYLGEPLFTHFSPVVRWVNWLAVGHIAEHPWLVPGVLLVLLAGVVLSAMWLLIVLFGPSWTALVGSCILGPSLALLQLGNWWTAGVNYLPAIIGCQVAFVAVVLIVRGRSLWWAVPCLIGIIVGVLDYEFAMLMPGYLGLWLLLFRGRVTDQSLLAVLRRTWWLWAGLILVSAISLLNYRINYYSPVPAPTVADGITAMAVVLFRTLVPSALGFHDPGTPWFATLGMVVGLVALAAVFAMTITRRGGWRGWLFAGAGWLLPGLALVLNRAGLFGTSVGENAMYVYFPTMLFIVGVLEAASAPRRRPVLATGTTSRRPVLITGIVAVVVAALAYAWSAPPTAAYQLPPGASPSYIDNARASAAALRESGGDFSVIDGDVPFSVILKDFSPTFSRVGNVLGITVPDLRFDGAIGPYYTVDESGTLQPVQVDDLFELQFEPGATDGLLSITGVDDHHYEPGRGSCFITRAESEIAVQLPETIVGEHLVVRTMASVDATSGKSLEIVPAAGSAPQPANHDGNLWYPDQPGWLDTVAAPSIDSLRIRDMTPGVSICISSISVGAVHPAQ